RGGSPCPPFLVHQLYRSGGPIWPPFHVSTLPLRLNPPLRQVPHVAGRSEIYIPFELGSGHHAELLRPKEIVGQLVGQDALRAGVYLFPLGKVVGRAPFQRQRIVLGRGETWEVEQLR